MLLRLALLASSLFVCNAAMGAGPERWPLSVDGERADVRYGYICSDLLPGEGPCTFVIDLHCPDTVWVHAVIKHHPPGDGAERNNVSPYALNEPREVFEGWEDLLDRVRELCPTS